MEAAKCIGGLLVLILMIYNVACAISVTCDQYRPMASQAVTCTCNTTSGKSITWNKDGNSITTCLTSSGACFPNPPIYEFSYNVSAGSIEYFYIKIKSFAYSSCGEYTCTDGTPASQSLEIAEFNTSLTVKEPPNVKEAGNISITTSCSYKQTDFSATWFFYYEPESRWSEYRANERNFTTFDSTNCTNTCGTNKAGQLTATLEHTINYTKTIEAKVGVKIVNMYYPTPDQDNNVPTWSSTGTYILEDCCYNQGTDFLVTCSVAVAFNSVLIILIIVLIIVGRQGKVVVLNLSGLDIAAAALDIMVFLYSLIVGAYTVANNDDCRNCTTCPYKKCDTSLSLGIASIVLSCVNVVVLIVFIIIRKGWCGERFSCLNRVLPVCKDTEQRGPPDGKPDSHAAKEKRREVTHNEQHNLKETGVHKDKPNKEKHEEPSKGRPLPQPTGSNRDDTGSAGAVSRQDVVLDRRPMPDIPSDRHKRGLSANFNDNRDTPLDDNIHVLHTLPVAKKPKNALDPMNTEGQSKNADDQPKKKKKKKDRDTSRSDDIEDDIESHGKVLAF